MIRHLCADIRGALSRKNISGIFNDKMGNNLSDRQARETLYDMLADGYEKVPSGNCDNFDKKRGCLGHDA